jgi:hypothetical protein
MKTMKKILFLMMIATATMVFVGCKSDDEATPNVYEDNDAPLYAASKKVWTFGEQTWSDAIHCPECNKEILESSYTDPQCRSYTENDKTWYYYNWAYVTQNAATLCPTPWHVPSQTDFNTLVSNTNYSVLINAWDYGGLAESSSMDVVSTDAAYWSSTEYSGNTNRAYSLYYYIDYLSVDHGVNKYVGFQVRCVK